MSLPSTTSTDRRHSSSASDEAKAEARAGGKNFAATLKQGWAGIHGAGEVVRGNVNSAIDNVFHKNKGPAADKAFNKKNDKIIDKGVDEMDRAKE